MSSSRKLLVINQYYAPDVASTGQLAAELCNSLARRGFEVHVVTGEPSYVRSAPEAPIFELRDGVYVYRVRMGRAKGRDTLTIRIAGYLRFLWGAWRLARDLARREPFECVMTFHNPPIIGLIGAYLAERHKLRFVYALYDIHPDVVLAAGWRLPRPLVWVWEAINQRVYRKANAIVVLGEGMRRTLAERKGVPPSKVQVVPPWARPELAPAAKDLAVRQELGIGEQELLVLYAGNMGVMHPLDSVLDAAASLQGLPIRFVLVGGGVRRSQLVARAAEQKIGQVVFLPYQPEERFTQLVAAADACLVVLKPGLERLAVPSRAFTFLSAGKPLITLMAPNAELARLVTEAECGWNVRNAQELAELLRELVKNSGELMRRAQKARSIYNTHFSRERIMDLYVQLLQGDVAA